MSHSTATTTTSDNACNGDGSATPERPPSPVQFTGDSSSSSRTSTPTRERAGDSFPTFTVTSSQYPPPTAARALNPQAKEFALPAGGSVFSPPAAAAPLFAMPQQQQQQQQQQRASPSSVMGSDFSAAPWGGARHSPGPGPASASGLAVDDGSAAHLLEAHIRRRFTADCQDRGQHMVAVFNLDPHTTRDALHRMFFQSGASGALVLRPSDFPPALAVTPLVSRRFVGVVFFPCKDMAVIGVEQRDHFVPTGQHHPLRVAYCGPDAAASALPGTALPPTTGTAPTTTTATTTTTVTVGAPWTLPAAELERVHEEMRLRYEGVAAATGRAMLALHGLDAASATAVMRGQVMAETGAQACEPWPPRHGRVQTPWRCLSISAVVWYPSEAAAVLAAEQLDGRPAAAADGQRYPLRAFFVPTGGSSPATRASPGSPLSNNDNTSINTNTSVETAQSGGADGDGADVFRSFDEAHRYFLGRWRDPSVHLVAVHNLDPATDKKRLYKIFYPIGAFDAELFPGPMKLGGKLRASGVALFNSKGMAEEAASKIDDFVPHGQTRPLVTFLLSRDDTTTTANNANNMSVRLATPVSASADGAASTPRPRGSTPPELLESVAGQLRSPALNAAALAETMAQLVVRPDAGNAEARALAAALSETLTGMKHHSMKLATPLSGALLELHERLGIRPTSGGEGWGGGVEEAAAAAAATAPPVSDAERERRADFVREIARAMLLLVASNDAQREPRSVAAMLCGYFFQFSYLPSTPVAFAVRLLQNNEAALREAKAYLGREPGVPTSADAERRNRPLITLVESLEEMTSLWRRGNRARYRRDDDARAYEGYINNFYDGNPPRSSATGSGKGSGSGGSGGSGGQGASSHNSPYCETLESSNGASVPSAVMGGGSGGSARRQALLTPSARPTPRPVVTRLSPGNNACGGSAVRAGFKAPAVPGILGVHGATQVVLSPASDTTQGVSADISLESNSNTQTAPHPLAGSLRSMGAILPGLHRSLAQPGSASGGGGMTGGIGVLRLPTNTNTNTSTSTASGVNTSSTTNTTGTTSGLLVSPEYYRADTTDCTVYVTKLPSSFTSGQVHRLLGHFGEVNKVRLCRDEKESVLPSASGAYSKLCFGFIEFAEPYSAKAMVEYFRNAVHTPSSFEFLRSTAEQPACRCFAKADIELLRSTRTSQARNPIHDQQPLDAVLRVATAADATAGAYVCARRCLFGVVLPDIAIETYNEACHGLPLEDPAPAPAPAAAPAPCATAANPPWFMDPAAAAPATTFEWTTSAVNAAERTDDADDEAGYISDMVAAAIQKMQGGGGGGAVGAERARSRSRDDGPVIENDDDDDDHDRELKDILALVQSPLE